MEFTKIPGSYYDAEISFRGHVIKGRNSKGFLKHLDDNVYFFSNDHEDYSFGFFEFIAKFPISELPDRTEYSIINVVAKKVENPLQRLPYPFNTTSFLKLDNQFYTQFSSFANDNLEGWNKKWTTDFYFQEFNKVIHSFPKVRIREDQDEEFSTGRLKIEILDDNSGTIDEAFSEALKILNKVIDEAESSLSGLHGLMHMIETWQKNKENKDEEFWQKLFSQYPNIISQAFSFPLVLFKDKAYVGGKSIYNESGKVVDYAFKNNLTNNLALLEIKTPQTPLLGGEYRGTYSISTELTGAINQILDYKDKTIKGFYSLVYESKDSFRLMNPKCLLLVGSLENLNARQKDVFEHFRNEFKSIEIITFDELFDKIYILFKLLQQ